MIKSVSIVFYKGPGTLGEKLIRLWTKSPYAHCEFRRSDGLYHSNDRFSFISRTELLEIIPEDWEECTLSLPSEIVERVERRQLRKNGTSYDWTGIIFSQLFHFGIHNKKRWFCSKSNADDLIYAYRLMVRSGHIRYHDYVNLLQPLAAFPSNIYSPSTLYTVLKKIESY